MLLSSVAATILLIVHGLPLFTGLATMAFLLYYLSGGQESVINTILDPMGRLTQNDLLLPLVLFSVTGYVLSHAGFPGRLFSVFHSMFNKSRKNTGFAVGAVAIIVSALFTPLSGASGITIVALGGILMPVLISAGFKKSQSLGIVTSSGSLGLLFFPSIPVILYGIISNNKVSIKELFIAGVVPGIILITLPIIYIYYLSKKNSDANINNSAERVNNESPLKFEWSKFIIEIIFIPVGFTLFIRGIITISEISLLAFLYYFILEVFIFKEIKLSKLVDILRDSFSLIGGILIIIFFAMAFTSYLIDNEIPQAFFNWISVYIESRWTFLILLNIFLLAVGAIMDIFSAIIVIAPLIIPVAELFGVNMVHLGILFLTNLEIGYITPPVGINLFLSSFRFKTPVTEIYKSVVPFFLIMIIAQILITYVPFLSLWAKN